MLAKHDEKYMPPEVVDALKKSGHWQETGAAAAERKRMIIELGHFALILALFVALVQSSVPLVGAARRHLGMMAVGRSAAVAQFVLVALAIAALMHAYVTSDFSVINVVENSHTDKPLLYKITGVWGNHEGSMVLWVFMLALCGAAVALFGDNLPPELRARVLAVQGMIGTGFLLFILLTSNPFLRTWPPPPNGRASTRCCRIPASPSIRRSSISAMSASRSPSPSPSRR